MGSSLLLSAQPQPQIRLLKTMKVLLLLAGLLLCLHLSEGFSYRGNVMRNRNRGSGSRSYLRNLGSGGRQRMGGMGFGKRAYDFYNPDEEQQDYYDELDEAELERLEEAAKILDMEEKAEGEEGHQLFEGEASLRNGSFIPSLKGTWKERCSIFPEEPGLCQVQHLSLKSIIGSRTYQKTKTLDTNISAFSFPHRGFH